MSKKTTQEEAEEIVNKKCVTLNCKLSKPFKYIDAHQTILYLECNIHDYKWNGIYHGFVRGKRTCKKCRYIKIAESNRISSKEAEINVNNRCIEMDYILTNTFNYIGANETILLLKCKKDEHKWPVSYHHFIHNKSGCPECAGSLPILQKEAEINVNNRCIEMDYILKQSFIYSTAKETRFFLKCNKDNNEWDVNYDNFVNGKTGCSKCQHEKMINTFIEKYGESYFHTIPKHNLESIYYLDLISEKLDIKIQHALNGGEKKFHRYWVDGYIEQYNICIEWNEKHHNLKKYIEKDLIRENYIIDNFGCQFININEKEFLDDIDNQINIVVNKIKQIINNLK